MRLTEAKARLEHLLSELYSSDAQTVLSLKESQFIPDALEIAVYAMRYLIDEGHEIELVKKARGEE